LFSAAFASRGKTPPEKPERARAAPLQHQNQNGIADEVRENKREELSLLQQKYG